MLCLCGGGGPQRGCEVPLDYIHPFSYAIFFKTYNGEQDSHHKMCARF